MKTKILFGALAATWAFYPIIGTSQSDDPTFDPLGKRVERSLPRQIMIEVEFFEMSAKEASALLYKHDLTSEQLRDKIAKLVEQDKAQELDSMSIIARSGERARVQSTETYIFPTEYDPSGVTEITDQGKKETRRTTNDGFPVTATAFEERPLGTTLEIEPTLGDDDATINLTLSPEITYHTGHTTWGKWKDKESEGELKMPTFYTLKVQTGLTLIDERYCHTGTISPKSADGKTDRSRKVLMFVRGRIRRAGE